MSKTKGTDRRSLLAAAAASAAMPLLASAAKAQNIAMTRPMMEGTKFQVDLGGVKLPEKAAAELGMQIRRSVLSACAQAGIRVRDVTEGHLNPGWQGIWVIPTDVNRHDVPIERQENQRQ
ncbi:MAG: hypothetical protein WDM89_19275 [Rhizomicrobium sp.]